MNFNHIVFFNRRFLVGILCILSMHSYSQSEIVINNPSFEDIPRQGVNKFVEIKGWYDCGLIRFPLESPPDIHPGNYWNVSLPPSHGNTYLGLVVRDNDTYEGLSQRLTSSIEAGKCYTFNIDLVKSQNYHSKSRITNEDVNYIIPTVLRVWGGNGYCDNKELLAESIPISHSDWRTYEFKIKAKRSHNFILVEAYYKTPVFLPYCGHLLLDNLSNIVEVPCEENQKEVAAVVPTKPKNNPLPPHKQGRIEPTPPPPITSTPTPPKVLTDLDINKIKTGSKIEIKNLYFKADSATMTGNSYIVLDELSDFLKQNTKVNIEIGGHTNGIPSHQFCDNLSTKRAKSVYDYLVAKGINKERLTYKGYGKRKRIAPDTTAEGRRKNQRVEITVLSVG